MRDRAIGAAILLCAALAAVEYARLRGVGHVTIIIDHGDDDEDGDECECDPPGDDRAAERLIRSALGAN